jgi:DNA-binding transcriptional MerR regulator
VIPRGQLSSANLVMARRSKRLRQRHELGYHIEEIERTLERGPGEDQDLEEFEAVVLRQRLAELKDRLRRLGGPIKEDEYGGLY